MPPAPVTPASEPTSVRLVMRADRMLAQHRLLLEQIAVDAPLAEVLQSLVRVIEEDSSDGLVASVMVADADGKHLRLGAGPSLPAAYNAAVDGMEIGPTMGSCGAAAHRREPVIATDLRTDPLWTDYQELARESGLRSCWSLPLLYGDELLGTFAMYFPASREPTEVDRETAAVYARTATLAIQRHRVEQARDEAREAEARYARKLSRLAAVSMQLVEADTVEDVVDVVLEHGLDVLGADDGVIGLLDDAGSTVRLKASESLGSVRLRHAEVLPRDSPLPVPTAVRTGTRVLLPDVASGLAFTPAMQQLYDDTGLRAFVAVPLVSGHRTLGALSVAWNHEREFHRTQLDFLDSLAAQAAQSLQRVRERAAERWVEDRTRRMSEALQRNLLTRPAQTERLSIAVRYEPAMEEAQIGGDWYDAFLTEGGAMMLVVGDVNGHDRDAAAGMAQMRNLLRGLAYSGDDTPAELLSRLDHASRGLELDSLATAVVAQVPPQPWSETLRVRWSSAGHPPPLLRTADGEVRVLETEPDLLLGLAIETPRRDLEVELADGATLLLYTDGLVENRGENLDDGIARLCTVLADRGDQRIERLCDEIVHHMVPDGGEDDVALLAVRPRAQVKRTAGSTGDTHTMAIANDPAAVHRARTFVDGVCRDADLPGDVRGNAVLLTSELVTNSIVHTGTDADLFVSAGTSRVRVEVRDGDRAMPQVEVPSEDATSGRGLVLVQLLASRWDTARRNGGKAVWFELDAS